MPNEMLNELDFQNHLKDMGDRDLLEFVARQTYETNLRCPKHDQRITDLEVKTKGISALSGAISGGFISAIIAIIEYFRMK